MDKKDRRGKPKVAIYARTSSDDLKLSKMEGTDDIDSGPDRQRKQSIPQQVREAQEYAKHNGLEVVAIYREPDISGRTYPTGYEIENDLAANAYFAKHNLKKGKQSRPELGKLLDTGDEIDGIIVRDVYRLMRPIHNSHLKNQIWQQLDSKNIILHSIADGVIDSSKFNNLMMIDIQLGMAHEAKLKEVENSRKALRKIKDDGGIASGVKCYGFESAGKRKVKGVPEELEIVRYIYDEFFKGTKVNVIAQKLNKKKIPTKLKGRVDKKTGEFKPYFWRYNSVTQILLNPYFCGLTYNTKKELIPSTVFPRGKKAVVTEEEFKKVLAVFEKRKRYYHKSSRFVIIDKLNMAKQTTGTRVGIEYTYVHPFSGLLRCGNCGFYMKVFSSHNKYYDTAPQIKTFYYHCKSHLTNPDNAEYDQCRSTRIKEAYPETILQMGIEPVGNGLIEALYPLLLHGVIERHIEQETIGPDLKKKCDDLERQVKAKKDYRLNLSDMLESGEIDRTEFVELMGKQREGSKQLEIEYQVALAEKERLSKGNCIVPLEELIDPANVKLEVIRELAHMTFEDIFVFPDKIKVVMKKRAGDDGENPSFELERVKIRNSKNLPFWKARINSTTVDRNTKIGIAYFYKSTMVGVYEKIDVLYSDDQMEVVVFGTNKSIDKKRAEEKPYQTQFDKIMDEEFGPAAKYGEKLVKNANVFFTGGMPDMTGCEVENFVEEDGKRGDVTGSLKGRK